MLDEKPYIWFSMGIDHSNPYIHSTTVLCDICLYLLTSVMDLKGMHSITTVAVKLSFTQLRKRPAPPYTVHTAGGVVLTYRLL